MRSLQEIDADIAEVENRIAQRKSLGYGYARTRAILDHDPSGIFQIDAALASAAENRRAREAQAKAAEIAREFQASEAQKNRDFQAAENAMNREDNRKVQDRNWYEEQARMVRDLRDNYDAWKASQQANVSELDRARARNALNYSRDIARKSGVPQEVLDMYSVEGPARTEPAEDAFVVDFNRATTAIKKAKTRGDVDSLYKELFDKYGEDPSNTDKLAELQKTADTRKKELSDAAAAAKQKRLTKEFLDSIKNDSKAWVEKMVTMGDNGVKTISVPKEYGGGKASFEELAPMKYRVTLNDQTIEVGD